MRIRHSISLPERTLFEWSKQAFSLSSKTCRWKRTSSKSSASVWTPIHGHQDNELVMSPQHAPRTQGLLGVRQSIKERAQCGLIMPPAPHGAAENWAAHLGRAGRTDRPARQVEVQAGGLP